MNGFINNTKKILAVFSVYVIALTSFASAQTGQTTVYVGGVATTLTQLAPNVQQGAIQVPLTNALLIAMNTTPIPIIPAFGAGTLVQVQFCHLDLIFATGAFSSGGTVTIGYGTTQSTVAASTAAATIASTVFTTFSANQNILVAGTVPVTVSSLNLNKAVSMTVGSGNFTNAASGTSTGILTCSYLVISGLS